MILFGLIKPGFLKKVLFRNLQFFRTPYPKSSPWPELKPLFLAWGRPAEEKIHPLSNRYHPGEGG